MVEVRYNKYDLYLGIINHFSSLTVFDCSLKAHIFFSLI